MSINELPPIDKNNENQEKSQNNPLDNWAYITYNEIKEKLPKVSRKSLNQEELYERLQLSQEIGTKSSELQYFWLPLELLFKVFTDNYTYIPTEYSTYCIQRTGKFDENGLTLYKIEKKTEEEPLYELITESAPVFVKWDGILNIPIPSEGKKNYKYTTTPIQGINNSL